MLLQYTIEELDKNLDPLLTSYSFPLYIYRCIKGHKNEIGASKKMRRLLEKLKYTNLGQEERMHFWRC
jgi:hypothetical protein